MFNWSEVHFYRCNFLQNPYFSTYCFSSNFRQNYLLATYLSKANFFLKYWKILIHFLAELLARERHLHNFWSRFYIVILEMTSFFQPIYFFQFLFGLPFISPFLFGLLFPFFIWTFISPFLFGLLFPFLIWTFIS